MPGPEDSLNTWLLNNEQIFVHIASPSPEFFHWRKFQGVHYSKDKRNKPYYTVLNKCCQTALQSYVSNSITPFKENSHHALNVLSHLHLWSHTPQTKTPEKAGWSHGKTKPETNTLFSPDQE